MGSLAGNGLTPNKKDASCLSQNGYGVLLLLLLLWLWLLLLLLLLLLLFRSVYSTRVWPQREQMQCRRT